MKFASLYTRVDAPLAACAAQVQPALLLVVRLWWGWSFFLTGVGKLRNLGDVAGFFTELGLPFPLLNAFLAGAIEAGGGLLLAVGLAARLASVPLIVTMLVAYATADREALLGIATEPDAFTGAAPFLFLFASALIFAFGPGRFSVDAYLARKRS